MKQQRSSYLYRHVCPIDDPENVSIKDMQAEILAEVREEIAGMNLRIDGHPLFKVLHGEPAQMVCTIAVIV